MRKVTEEQKQKAAERRQKMRAIAGNISKMSAEDRAALAQRIAPTTIEGRTLSPFNCCMVAMQDPNATVVGGFRQWLKAGRCVRKGEKGLAIWIPVGVGKPGEESQAAGDESNLRFILGTVFDVSQTEETAAEPKQEPTYGALDSSWGGFAGQPVLKLEAA